jgi:hypothetical protein
VGKVEVFYPSSANDYVNFEDMQSQLEALAAGVNSIDNEQLNGECVQGSNIYPASIGATQLQAGLLPTWIGTMSWDNNPSLRTNMWTRYDNASSHVPIAEWTAPYNMRVFFMGSTWIAATHAGQHYFGVGYGDAGTDPSTDNKGVRWDFTLAAAPASIIVPIIGNVAVVQGDKYNFKFQGAQSAFGNGADVDNQKSILHLKGSCMVYAIPMT